MEPICLNASPSTHGLSTSLLAHHASVSVAEFRCNSRVAGQHEYPSISYVRKEAHSAIGRAGSLSTRLRGRPVGRPDVNMCMRAQITAALGGECLSFRFAPELGSRQIGDYPEVWRIGCAPPLVELMVLGELAQATADGANDLDLDEVGLLFAARLVEVVSGRKQKWPGGTASDRRRAVECGFMDRGPRGPARLISRRRRKWPVSARFQLSADILERPRGHAASISGALPACAEPPVF